MARRFGRAKSFNKMNVKKIPEDKPILYRFKSEKNKELYIGVAKKSRTQERLSEHLTKKGEKIPGAKKFQVLQFSNIKKAKVAEKKLIKKLNPKYNKEET